MKVILQAVTARINGKLIGYEGINDSYTSVQLCVKKADLDKETIKVLSDNRFIFESEDSFNLGENEAKDYQMKYGNLEVQIEDFEVKE